MEQIVIRLDGGIGRVIAASGALEQFALANKDKKVYAVSSFPQILNGLEGIERIYPIGTPFLYEDIISKSDYREPEPYNDYRYYAENKHIAQVFNYLLNNIDEMILPKIVLTENEKDAAKQFADEQRKTGKKVVLIQPWGSTGGKVPGNCADGKCDPVEQKPMVDETYRSLGTEFAKRLVSRLQEENYVVYVVKTGDQMGFKDALTFQNTDVRKIIALIPYVDGVIACDSFLHHASAALGTPVPTIVLWAGTSDKNLGYEGQLNLHSWKKTEPEPNRVPHDHDYYVNKNKSSNEFKIELIDEIISKLEEKA